MGDMPVDYVPCIAKHSARPVLECTSYLSRATSDTAWHSGIQLPTGRPYQDIVVLKRGPYAKKLTLNSALRVNIPGDPSPEPRGVSFTFTSREPLGPCPPDIAKPCVFVKAISFQVRYAQPVK